MITLHKRIEKNKKKLRGIEVLYPEDNPLLQPTMLCLSAQTMYPKSIYGIVREGMRAARLRTSQGIGAKYALDNFPINFVGATYDNQGNSFGESIAEEYFKPLISENGAKLDLKQAKKNMRNITIMTYCDGTLVYYDLEAKLVNIMESLGYTEKEIKAILAELAVIAVLTMHDTANSLATTFQLVDVNDAEIFERATPSLIESLDRQLTNHDFLSIGKHNGLYYFKGKGEHSIKSFFHDDYLPQSVFAAIVSQCLTRSIDKHHEFSFENMSEMIKSILNHYSVGYTAEEIMKDLDDMIDYPGARKLTSFECNYLDIIDELSKKASNLENDNRLLRNANDRQRQNYDKLDEAIRTTVSAQEYHEILTKIGYQFPASESTYKK